MAVDRQQDGHDSARAPSARATSEKVDPVGEPEMVDEADEDVPAVVVTSSSGGVDGGTFTSTAGSNEGDGGMEPSMAPPSASFG